MRLQIIKNITINDELFGTSLPLTIYTSCLLIDLAEYQLWVDGAPKRLSGTRGRRLTEAPLRGCSEWQPGRLVRLSPALLGPHTALSRFCSAPPGTPGLLPSEVVPVPCSCGSVHTRLCGSDPSPPSASLAASQPRHAGPRLRLRLSGTMGGPLFLGGISSRSRLTSPPGFCP